MPQQDLYRYDVTYQGYRFSIDGYRQPTLDEVHKMWVDSVVSRQPFSMDTLGIDFSGVETDMQRAERNANEVGSLQPDQAYRDATFWQRFWDSAKLSAIPHFGTMESHLTPADESSELWAEALGGLGGAVVGMLPFSLAGGGVPGIAAGGANVVHKVNRARKLFQLADRARKVGKTATADKILDRANRFVQSNNKIFKEAIRTRSLPTPTGLLGKTKPYRETILKIAEKNPKLARALNLFSNNVVTFGLYGQTKLPYDKLEGRLEQLGNDTIASAIFSVAGLPTMLGYASKGVKYGVEPGMLMGAGMYSDAGQSDMTMEERLIHGSSLVAFHYARQGLSALQIKEKIGTAFRLADPSLSEAQLTTIKDSSGMIRVIDVAQKEALKYPTYADRQNPDRTVELLRVEKPVKGKTTKYRVVYQDLGTSEIRAIQGNSRPDAWNKFSKKFSKNTPPQRERVVGKELTVEQKQDLKEHKQSEKILRKALGSPRGMEVGELPKSVVSTEVRDPFEITRGVENVEMWKSKVDEASSNMDMLYEQYTLDLKKPNVNKTRLKHILDKEIGEWEKIRYTAGIKLEQAYKKVSSYTGERFHPNTAGLKEGEFVKIPKFDENTGQLDYSRAGIGKYVGTLNDFKPGEVIAPGWMQKEPTRYSNYFRQIPVFEINTHGGARRAKVAIGGKMPEKVAKAIEKANSADKPLLEYAEDSPKVKEIRENPVVKQEYKEPPVDPTAGPVEQSLQRSRPLIRQLIWNPLSKIFKQLFTDKPRGGAKNLRSITVQEKGMVSPTGRAVSEAARETGIKETQRPYRSAAKNTGYISNMVRAFERDWIKNQGSYFGAKTKAPYDTADFKKLHNEASRMGYKFSAKHLWEQFRKDGIFDLGARPGLVDKTYYAYSPNTIKKIKLSTGERVFPDGIPTPEGAMKIEADRVETIAKDLSATREKERAKFQQFKGAEAEQWPDMNKMPRDLTIDKATYEAYPEFDPLNSEPYFVWLKWDARENNKIVTHKRKAMKGNKIATFKTKEEAEQFALDHWMNPEGVEKLLTSKIDKISSLQGPEYTELERQRGRLKKVQREEKIPDAEYKFLLNEWFPESRGSSKNMTHEELQVASSMLSSKDNTKAYQNKISSTVPPANVMSHMQVKWKRVLTELQKFFLPAYTTLQLAKSRIASSWGRDMITHEITRQLISGDFSEFKINLKNVYGLGKKDYKNLSSILDKKFEDWYDPRMDKYPIEDIQKAYKLFQHKVVAEYLIPSGVEVRNASTRDARYEPLFEVYDASGNRIEIANGYDAIRLVEGIDFLDSRGGTKPPPPQEKFKIVDGKVVGEAAEGISFEYIKSLRRLNRETGKYEGGWYIQGKDRYAFKWTDKNTVKVERLNSKQIETKDGKYVTVHDRDGAPGKFNHHIEKNYLTRIVTDEFRELMGLDKGFREQIAEIISRTDPEFVNMAGTPLEKKIAALQRLHYIDKFWKDQAGVFGTQYSRVAKLPPIIAIEAKTNKIIELKGFKDINGKPVSKKSTVIDAHGKRRSVDRVIDVYERNFDKIISRQGQRVAHIAPTFKLFGKGGANNDKVLNERDRLILETDESFANWAHETLQLQINAVQKNHLYDGPLRGLTMVTAQIGLSFPLSGYKNVVLGQQSNATVFGFRQTLNGMFRSLSDRKAMSNLTGRIGGKEAGVHELMSGRIVYAKYNPGMMRITEIMNRIVSTSIAEPAFKSHLDNLNGIKNIMNVGVSRDTSMRFFTDIVKLTDAQIAEAKRLGSTRINERPDLIQRAQSMAHLITQGGPALPFVPRWMGKNWAKPLTLFYRVAYRMTENVVNSVIKPLVADGNPVPLVRYLSLLPLSGAALYSAHYLVLGEEQRNRFKGFVDQLFELSLRAEGLAVGSNAFDDYGNVIESYQPAVYRSVKSLGQNIYAILAGKKFVGQAVEDLATETVVLANRAVKIHERVFAPLKKSFNDSRRRQRQFTDVYFRENPVIGDELSMLTSRSPYYRHVKDAFWSDDDELKARVYYAARNYVAQHEINKDPSLKKIPHKAKKLARTNLKTVVSAQRPIPTSWRKRTTGARTRYEIYLSKLSPELRAKEEYIENQYQKKLQQWRAAVSQYGAQYNLDFFPGPSK